VTARVRLPMNRCRDSGRCEVCASVPSVCSVNARSGAEREGGAQGRCRVVEVVFVESGPFLEERGGACGHGGGSGPKSGIDTMNFERVRGGKVTITDATEGGGREGGVMDKSPLGRPAEAAEMRVKIVELGSMSNWKGGDNSGVDSYGTGDMYDVETPR